jgi:hypothetical protein
MTNFSEIGYEMEETVCEELVCKYSRRRRFIYEDAS